MTIMVITTPLRTYADASTSSLVFVRDGSTFSSLGYVSTDVLRVTSLSGRYRTYSSYYNLVQTSNLVLLNSSDSIYMFHFKDGSVLYSTTSSYSTSSYVFQPYLVDDYSDIISSSTSYIVESIYNTFSFPRSTDMSYSTLYYDFDYDNDNYQNITVSSLGDHIYSIYYQVYFDGSFTLPQGSYMFRSLQNDVPSFNYLSKFSTRILDCNPGTFSSQAISFSVNARSFEYYFNVSYEAINRSYLYFYVLAYIPDDDGIPIGSFSLRNFTYQFLRSDSSEILLKLSDSFSALTDANGANSSLDDKTDEVGSVFESYTQNTDTSSAYTNIPDTLFDVSSLDIFTQVLQTSQFFGLLVSSLFSKLGDFAVPLTLFLTMAFVSYILNIVSSSRG